MNFSDILISYDLPSNCSLPTSNTKRQDSLNNRHVEKGNECSVYLKLTQFPEKKRAVCLL